MPEGQIVDIKQCFTRLKQRASLKIREGLKHKLEILTGEGKKLFDRDFISHFFCTFSNSYFHFMC
jgi:hypothetical protein